MTLGGSPMPSMLPVFYLPTQHLLLGAGLMVALGLVTGALPAIQAMRLGVSEALRRQA
jgi:putative ABC transport system permease protein